MISARNGILELLGEKVPDFEGYASTATVGLEPYRELATDDDMYWSSSPNRVLDLLHTTASPFCFNVSARADGWPEPRLHASSYNQIEQWMIWVVRMLTRSNQ